MADDNVVQPSEWNRTGPELWRVLAELRHAYWNLVRPDNVARWDRQQRTEFAEGLIAPQIRKLEALEEYHRPVPVQAPNPPTRAKLWAAASLKGPDGR